jgi:hypothetical protein
MHVMADRERRVMLRRCQMALGPKTKNACSDAKVIKRAMSVYSIAFPRCLFFFTKGLRLMAFKLSLPTTGNLPRTAVLTPKL